MSHLRTSIIPVVPSDRKFTFETAQCERLLQENAQKRLNEIIRDLQREAYKRSVPRPRAASEIVRNSEQYQPIAS